MKRLLVTLHLLAVLLVGTIVGTSAVAEGASVLVDTVADGAAGPTEQVAQAEKAEKARDHATPIALSAPRHHRDHGAGIEGDVDGEVEPEKTMEPGVALTSPPILVPTAIALSVRLALDHASTDRIEDVHVLGWASPGWHGSLSARGPPTGC